MLLYFIIQSFAASCCVITSDMRLFLCHWEVKESVCSKNTKLLKLLKAGLRRLLSSTLKKVLLTCLYIDGWLEVLPASVGRSKPFLKRPLHLWLASRLFITKGGVGIPVVWNHLSGRIFTKTWAKFIRQIVSTFEHWRQLDAVDKTELIWLRKCCIKKRGMSYIARLSFAAGKK